jgi:hypothetical protein
MRRRYKKEKISGHKNVRHPVPNVYTQLLSSNAADFVFVPD